MISPRAKWLVYTVLVGLIPILVRLLAWCLTTPGTVEVITPADLVAFGLVLHISSINEVEHAPSVGQQWKTIQNGLSIFFITVYGFLLGVTLIGAKVTNPDHVLICTGVMSLVSLAISFAVHKRLPTVDTHP